MNHFIMTKKCSGCLRDLEPSSFCANLTKKDGLDARCKDCKREYYLFNRDKISAQRKSYYTQNRRRLSDGNRRYALGHKEEKALYDESYRIKNANRIREYKRKWNNKNKHLPHLKVKRNLRRRLCHVIKDGYKSAPTLTLLGCDFLFFMSYLEGKFEPGMTWDNYGDWHIDHKIPCSSFDLTKPDEQRMCFNYENLQPLWAKENLQKADKIL